MHRRQRYILCILIALLGLSNLLTGCGQKGPLYLPEPETETEQQEEKN